MKRSNHKKVWLFKSEVRNFVKKPVDLIIVSHCRFDHILFLNELKRINKCIEKLNEIDKVVKEGDVINIGEFTFKILETPGHTNKTLQKLKKLKAKILCPGHWDVVYF